LNDLTLSVCWNFHIILKLVDDSIKPHLEKVKQCQEAITHKEIEINKQNKVIKSLQDIHSTVK
jgi:hypothetical protein